MRKFIFGTTFLLLAPFCLIFLLIGVLFVYQYHRTAPEATALSASVAYAALPTSQNILSTHIGVGDGRVEMIQEFLQRYNSPLAPFAPQIVADADKYHIDFRLLPSISMQESGGCRHEIPNSHNCYGFGIYGNKVIYFPSYPAGIDTVSKALAEKYKDNGLVTPDQIMAKWNPSSNGSWANGVNYFMGELQ